LGLGNFWRFPYLLGEHGGAPFMASYLLFLFGAAAPLLIAELVVGRHGRGNPLASLASCAERAGVSRVPAVLVGLGFCAVAFGSLLLVIVSGAWSWSYAFDHALGGFLDLPLLDVSGHFSRLLQAPIELLGWQTLLVLAALALAALPVHWGLKPALWVVVPLLFVVLAVLLSFSFAHGDLPATDRFLFADATQDFRQRSVLAAMQHAFYTLGIGAGVGIALAAYAPRELPLARTVFAVAVLDTAVSLAAALVIVPLVLGANVQMGEGPAVLFVAMSYAYGSLPGGALTGALFFATVGLVALVSALCLLEPLVSVLQSLLQWSRWRAALLCMTLVWLVSTALMLSLSIADEDQVSFSLLVVLDALVFRYLMPLMLLGLLALVAWFLPAMILRSEMRRETTGLFLTWLALLRYVALPTLAIIMLMGWFAN
jgi:NSS family neurotransmitter:Na+ symporter